MIQTIERERKGEKKSFLNIAISILTAILTVCCVCLVLACISNSSISPPVLEWPNVNRGWNARIWVLKFRKSSGLFLTATAFAEIVCVWLPFFCWFDKTTTERKCNAWCISNLRRTYWQPHIVDMNFGIDKHYVRNSKDFE